MNTLPKFLKRKKKKQHKDSVWLILLTTLETAIEVLSLNDLHPVTGLEEILVANANHKSYKSLPLKFGVYLE